MDPAEVEFICEREPIQIVPKFNAGTIYLLQGDYGPFKAGLTVKVPLWVGVNLRQRQKCRILQPDWMNIDTIEELKEAEKESPGFAAMPHEHMFVIAQLILDVATPDISKADEIRTTLKDIWDIRQSKLRKMMDTFVQSGALRATINNVQLIELNTVRPLLPHTLDQIYRLEIATADLARRRQSTTGNASNLNSTTY